IDPQDPNLYTHLKHQRLEIFSPELIKKSLLITPLPTNPISQITLSHGERVLPNLETLLSYISKARRKPIPIDIIYEEQNNISTQLATRMNTQISTSLCTQISSRLSSQLQSPLRTPRSNQAIQPILDVSLLSSQRRTPQGGNDTWALGSVAGTVPGRGAASLKTQIAYLGPLNNFSININPNGWIQDFLDLAQYSKMSMLTPAHSPFKLTRQHPLDVEVCVWPIQQNEKLIRTMGPNVSLTMWPKYDLLMTFHPLKIMQPTLECTKLVHSVSMNPKKSLQQIQIPLIQSKIDILPQLVCHCVAVTGDIILPSEIYFLEAWFLFFSWHLFLLLIPSLIDDGLMGIMLLLESNYSSSITNAMMSVGL
ncbi:alphaK I8, partial [Puccinia sorghi]